MPNKAGTYSAETILQETIKHFQGDELAATIWLEKYALKNSQNELVEKTPDDSHRRVAREFARIEKKYPNPMTEAEIFALVQHDCYVVVAGSPFFGIGNSYQTTSMSNCFVINTVDSYGGICRADERIAQISKRRGGWV